MTTIAKYSNQPLNASLSLDLDNKWSYMKTHGDPGWEDFPSYFDIVVPRFIDFFEERGMKITVFVVGQDAALEKNQDALSMISAAGHEVGNHSFHHEPWLHLYSDDEVETEIEKAEEHIERATGERCVGFRGPGYSVSPAVLRALCRRGYLYDASTFPTFLGPLAKTYYFMTARLNAKQLKQRKQLFGKFRDGFKQLKPYQWQFEDSRLLEIPVTTMPILKVPIHLSYLLYISQFSNAVAINYFRLALQMCRITGTEPSILLHPLDFLGANDGIGLEFFPAAGLDALQKLDLVNEAIDLLEARHQVLTMREHASSIVESPNDSLAVATT